MAREESSAIAASAPDYPRSPRPSSQKGGGAVGGRVSWARSSGCRKRRKKEVGVAEEEAREVGVAAVTVVMSVADFDTSFDLIPLGVPEGVLLGVPDGVTDLGVPMGVTDLGVPLGVVFPTTSRQFLFLLSLYTYLRRQEPSSFLFFFLFFLFLLLSGCDVSHEDVAIGDHLLFYVVVARVDRSPRVRWLRDDRRRR